MQATKARIVLQGRRQKLSASYHELLDEFSAQELQSVGNYSLGRLVGKGSFGKVYLATHKLTNGTKVVLKSADKDDPNLAREIHHHRQFIHPHIARLYEVLITETLVWLVLEYCPGDELYNYLLHHGALQEEKCRKIFSQLVGAVAYVHKMSCVHRDLKLENILLDRDGNVKLCDFGFTREYEGKMSYLHTFCGTVCYSAPEMLKGEKYAGEKVDVWSLGIILYAILTGQLPFDDDSDVVTKQKIIFEDAPIPETLSADAKVLICQLLSKRALLRPSLLEVLDSSFLSAYAGEQHVILNLEVPVPFSTELEKTNLLRLRSAGIDVERLSEHVICQRCDALAGWWALIMEKEERKQRRKAEKLLNREDESKGGRRLSATSKSSNRRERPTSGGLKPLQDRSQGHSPSPRTSIARGRQNRRSLPPAQISLHDLPRLPENIPLTSPELQVISPQMSASTPHLDRVNTAGKHPELEEEASMEEARPMNALLSESAPQLKYVGKGHGKRNRPLLTQLMSLKLWIRGGIKRQRPVPPHTEPLKPGIATQKAITSTTSLNMISPHEQVIKSSGTSHQAPMNDSTLRKQSRIKSRSSLSPSPLTPHSSRRVSSATGGLRGRKSTSSSVSSIRSVHYVPGHSKASSTSSTSNSIKNSTPFTRTVSHSPHSSFKALPMIPAHTGLPSSSRHKRSKKPSYEECAVFGTSSSNIAGRKGKKSFARASQSPSNTHVSERPLELNRMHDIDRGGGQAIQEEDEDNFEDTDIIGPSLSK